MSEKKSPAKREREELAPGIKKVEPDDRIFPYHTQVEREIRGMVLYSAVFVEDVIVRVSRLYLARKIMNDQLVNDLVYKHLNSRHFRKMQIFQLVLEKAFPDILEEYPDLLREIKFIQQVRNIIAHAQSNLSDDDRIQFTEYQPAINKDYITGDDAVEYSFLCGKVHKQILDIGGEITKRTPVKKDEE